MRLHKPEQFKQHSLLQEAKSSASKPTKSSGKLNVIASDFKKVQQGYRLPQEPDCPDKLYTIMQDCWKGKPDSRPTFKTLQQQLEELFKIKEPGLKPKIPPKPKN